MSEALLTTAEAAERFGVTTGSFQNFVTSLDLAPAEQRGRAKLYLPADVDRAVAARDRRKKAARKAAPRTKKSTAAATEQANAKMLEGLGDSPGGSLPNLAEDMTPTDSESAVVWAAHLDGSLGNKSRWYDRTPPASYERAYLAREAARADLELVTA